MVIETRRHSRTFGSGDIENAKRMVLSHAPHLDSDVITIRSAMMTLLNKLSISYPERLPETCAIGEVDGIDDRRLLIDGRDIYCVPTHWLCQNRYSNRDGIKLTVVSRVC